MMPRPIAPTDKPVPLSKQEGETVIAAVEIAYNEGIATDDMLWLAKRLATAFGLEWPTWIKLENIG